MLYKGNLVGEHFSATNTAIVLVTRLSISLQFNEVGKRIANHQNTNHSSRLTFSNVLKTLI